MSSCRADERTGDDPRQQLETEYKATRPKGQVSKQVSQLGRWALPKPRNAQTQLSLLQWLVRTFLLLMSNDGKPREGNPSWFQGLVWVFFYAALF